MKYEISPKLVFYSTIAGLIGTLLSIGWIGYLIIDKVKTKSDANVPK